MPFQDSISLHIKGARRNFVSSQREKSWTRRCLIIHHNYVPAAGKFVAPSLLQRLLVTRGPFSSRYFIGFLKWVTLSIMPDWQLQLPLARLGNGWHSSSSSPPLPQRPPDDFSMSPQDPSTPASGHRTAGKNSGPSLNIKTVFPVYVDSHVKDKTVPRPSYL